MHPRDLRRVRVGGQEGGLGEQPGALGAVERDDVEARGRRVHAIEPRELGIGDGPVGGEQRVERAVAVAQHRGGEAPGLLLDARDELGRPLGEDLGILGEVGKGGRAEPLAMKARDRGVGSRVVEHAPRVRLQHLQVAQLARFGGRDERVVGKRRPHEVRKPRRDGPVVERDELARHAGRGLHVIEKVRRHQHRGDHRRDRLGVAPLGARRRKELLVVGDLRGRERPSKRAAAELGEEARHAAGRGRVAAHDLVPALGHRRVRDLFGGGHVLVELRLRERSHRVRGESGHLLVGRELLARRRVVAEQVADRVVVLEAGQPSHRREHLTACAAGGLGRLPARVVVRIGVRIVVRVVAGVVGRTVGRTGVARNVVLPALIAADERETEHRQHRRFPRRPPHANPWLHHRCPRLRRGRKIVRAS